MGCAMRIPSTSTPVDLCLILVDVWLDMKALSHYKTYYLITTSLSHYVIILGTEKPSAGDKENLDEVFKGINNVKDVRQVNLRYLQSIHYFELISKLFPLILKLLINTSANQNMIKILTYHVKMIGRSKKCAH